MTLATKRRNRDFFDAAKQRIQKSHKGGLDAIFLTHKEDAGTDRCFFLATGIHHGHFLYASAVVQADGSAHLFVHELEEEEAKTAGLPYSIVKPGEDTVVKFLRPHTHIGINAHAITLAEAGKLKDKKFSLVNIAPELEDARAVKNPQEIDFLREAARIAGETAKAIPKFIRPGISERELAARIDYEMARLGSDGTAFTTITAFGDNSAIPHAQPGKRTLKKGDFILCDFGATAGKMSSDITRTYCFGKASKEQHGLYQAILNIQQKALSELKVGSNGKKLHSDADGAVVEFFRKAGAPKGKMGHGLGHSIGLYTHDGKRLGSTDYIVPDHFATTVEPAGYLPGFGGVRIEDTVLVTKKGVEILTDCAPKAELIEIGSV